MGRRPFFVPNRSGLPYLLLVLRVFLRIARNNRQNRGAVVGSECTVQVEFHRPPAALRPFFTTFYLTTITTTAPATGAATATGTATGANAPRITDWLQPEWANLRMFSGDYPDSDIAGTSPMAGCPAIFTGPTSRAVRFATGTTRIWGIGLLPLGWARFVDGPASAFADRQVDPLATQALARLAPLAQGLFGAQPDPEGELTSIRNHFERHLGEPAPDEPRIAAIHAALVDPRVSTVAALAEAAGVAAHTLERLCGRYFGFTPRLLLRRQRFMRSLAQYMLDPGLLWIDAIDSQYHDQAQFVRDFRRFMGMSPTAYAATPHPVLAEVMRARQQAAGAAVQALHVPGVEEPLNR